MQSLLKSLNIPNTLLLGGLSLIITHASAAGKPAHAWSVVETAKDNGHRLSAVPAPTKAAASAENAITYGPSFYYLARFSKFVQPGARRIHSDGGPQGIQSIAFSNGESNQTSRRFHTRCRGRKCGVHDSRTRHPDLL